MRPPDANSRDGLWAMLTVGVVGLASVLSVASMARWCDEHQDRLQYQLDAARSHARRMERERDEVLRMVRLE